MRHAYDRCCSVAIVHLGVGMSHITGGGKQIIDGALKIDLRELSPIWRCSTPFRYDIMTSILNCMCVQPTIRSTWATRT